jgi:cell fate (sporulation/competence/biofilm development) regulator YlbF (YheA/YmcA/DUF963 family)
MVDNLEEILNLAATLGQAIRRHPRYAMLRETDTRVRADKAATEALDAYNRTVADLTRKERAGLPIEVDEKRRLERLRQVVASNETVKSFMRAHADFAELMRRMNESIHKAMNTPKEPEQGQAPQAPSGPETPKM